MNGVNKSIVHIAVHAHIAITESATAVKSSMKSSMMCSGNKWVKGKRKEVGLFFCAKLAMYDSR